MVLLYSDEMTYGNKQDYLKHGLMKMILLQKLVTIQKMF